MVEEFREVLDGKESGSDASDCAHEDHGEKRKSDEARDAGGLGTDSEADGDFAAALEDGIVEHAIETDGGEEQGDDGEESGESGEETFAIGLAQDQFVFRINIASAEV